MAAARRGPCKAATNQKLRTAGHAGVGHNGNRVSRTQVRSTPSLKAAVRRAYRSAPVLVRLAWRATIQDMRQNATFTYLPPPKNLRCCLFLKIRMCVPPLCSTCMLLMRQEEGSEILMTSKQCDKVFELEAYSHACPFLRRA